MEVFIYSIRSVDHDVQELGASSSLDQAKRDIDAKVKDTLAYMDEDRDESEYPEFYWKETNPGIYWMSTSLCQGWDLIIQRTKVDE